MMKYVCSFDIEKCDENREYALSAKDKAMFLLNVIAGLGKKIDVISPTVTLNRRFYKKRIDYLSDRIVLISGPTVPYLSVLNNKLAKVFSNVWLMLYLILNCEKNETVYVYHVYNLIPFIKIAKTIKKLNICVEVEEIYSLIGNKNSSKIKRELKFLQNCDSYILASNELRRLIDFKDKKYIIFSGKFEPIKKYYIEPVPLIPKRVVYSGLISRNGMAKVALEMCKYLDSSYEVFFIGYGADEDILKFQIDIKNNNAQSACKAYFDGVYRGEEYNKYLQKCHIGVCPLSDELSTQTACFPSKISSYLSNGLHVVTPLNRTIMKSSVGKLISYSENNEPKNLAEAIKKTEIGNSDIAKEINDVYESFKEKVSVFIN